MKLYQKKSASLEDETVLVQLERRHTLKEDASEADSGNLRKKIRANSLDSLGEGPSSTDVEAVTAEKQNIFTRKPTVITENELSSSWLYKDRKAKINSDDESVEDPKPATPQENTEDLEPRTLRDPQLKPVPVSNQRFRKISSCCWYLMIILVICIASVAVVAGVGGIIYMEYFAINQENDTEITNASVKNDNTSASKERFPHTTHKNNFHRNEPIIPESVLKSIIEKSKTQAAKNNVSRKETIPTSQLNEDKFHKEDLTDSENSKTSKLNNVENRLVSENQNIDMTEHPKVPEHPDVTKNIHARSNHFTVPILDKMEESNKKNQDSSDLNLNLPSTADMGNIPNGDVDMVDEQITRSKSIVTEQSNFKADTLDSSAEILMFGRNFNFDETTTLQDIELKGKNEKADTFQNLPELHNLSNNSLDLIVNSINDNFEANSIDNRKQANDPEDNAIDHDLENNSFDHQKQAIDHDPEGNVIDHDPEDNVNDYDPEDNVIDHGPEDNVIDHDPEDHANDYDSEDNADDYYYDSEDNADDYYYDSEDNADDHDSEDNAFDHDPEGNAIDHRKQAIDHDSEDNSFGHRKQAIDHDPKDNSFSNRKQAIDHDFEDNSLNHAEHSTDSNNSSNDHSEDSSDGHSQVIDQNQNSDDSSQLVFIRPVAESEAVPVPLAVLRRIGFDLKNLNIHQPVTAQDMDIKFSLAEALKYLRSLDTESKLPVSREKIINRKTINQEESKKTQLPIKSEREEYLNHLRKHIFEESS